jgi:hypothetical protein
MIMAAKAENILTQELSVQDQPARMPVRKVPGLGGANRVCLVYDALRRSSGLYRCSTQVFRALPRFAETPSVERLAGSGSTMLNVSECIEGWI